MKRLVLILAVLALGSTALAQETKTAKQERQERIALMRIGYITEQISLTEDQSEEFWTIYNRATEEFTIILQERKALKKKMKKSVANIDDVNRWLTLEAQIVDKKREFVPLMLEVISEDQLAKLFIAEENFKSELIKTLTK